MWPDFPDVVINGSLDWETQVEVKDPLWTWEKSGLLGRGGHSQDSGFPHACAFRNTLRDYVLCVHLCGNHFICNILLPVGRQGLLSSA